jgi:hypothetical protein
MEFFRKFNIVTHLWACNQGKGLWRCGQRVWESVREWTPHIPKWAPILGIGVLMDFWFSESDCRSQNPLDRRVPYIIEKLLEPKCLKWARMADLGT